MRLSMRSAKPQAVGRPAKADIVLIHGTGSNNEMWSPQVEFLTANGHRCFLPDLRGHGETPEPMEPTGIDVHIQDLLETVESSEINFPAVFVGHSLGAIISLALAQKRPELFHGIFAAAMPGKVLAPVSFGFRMILKCPYEKLRGTHVHKSLPWRPRTLISTDRFTLNQIVENFRHLDYVSQPFQVNCPVHFSAGHLDPVAPYVYIKQMHQALPNSTLKLFGMAGHNFMDQRAAEFNNWLLEHLPEGNSNH